ncbi:hypothetical protein [Fictibacillus sp. BK138]|uniref:hypothetical protein n=1 Tax=Fictibacillus sp. BK138 TaxID=2512121 RepID=UPI0010290DB0|nr:hypothetical protein [Fictibacillus sp. BK138]RZT23839.1 hypothetical protein EV282_2936 [Fictibacillus sp. BK138]
MKKKLLIAAFLLFGFAFASTFVKGQDSQIKKAETTDTPRSIKDGTVLFKGENDYWEAEFLITKNMVNQLKLKRISTKNQLPQQLSFTLSTAFDQDRKQQQIGAFTVSFDEFPSELSLEFKENKLLQPLGDNLVLKINGDGHYQFFNMYAVD